MECSIKVNMRSIYGIFVKPQMLSKVRKVRIYGVKVRKVETAGFNNTKFYRGVVETWWGRSRREKKEIVLSGRLGEQVNQLL